MRFIIEFDGVLTDVRAARYAAHRRVAESLGWSALDEASFWQTLRSKGPDGVFLRGARAGLADRYHPAFAQECEHDECLGACGVIEDSIDVLKRLGRHGTTVAVTRGANIDSRRTLAARWQLTPHLESIEALNSDPRRRPAELVALSGGDKRTVVVAASDAVIRAASQTDFVKVSVSTGDCSIRRLHQAGADLVYREMLELVDSLDSGATDLIEAGLLPDVGRTL